MKRRENAGWGSDINPGISWAGLLKKSPDFATPIIGLWGIVTLQNWKDFFQYCLHWLLVLVFSFPSTCDPFFRVMYMLYVLYIGKCSFSRHTTVPCPFFCHSYKGQDSFLSSPSFLLLSMQFWRPVESRSLFPPSAINCLCLMLRSSLVAPHAPPLQGQTLGRTCTPLKPSIAS